MREKNVFALIIGLIVICVAVVGLFSLISSTNTVNTSNQNNSNNISNNLEVSDISIVSEGYSMYTVSCDLTPKIDYDYLEMQVIFYDSNNAVIGKSPLVWNINNPTKDQLIKVSGTATTSSSSTIPTRAEIYIFDSAFSSNPENAIYVGNVTLN